MSVFKTTFSRALNISPSEFANIPYPNAIATGLTSNSSPFQLIDINASFKIDNVKTGDIVYNIDTTARATVLEVLDKNTLLLNADIFGSIGLKYTVYQASPQTGLGNQGCYLYIGDSDTNYEVVTIGGDTVMFTKPQVGTVLPVQVIKVISGGACIALW